MADPSKSELLELARQAVSAEDYIRADEYYSQAIRFMPSSDPDYAECLECLVSLKQARGDFPAALEYSLRLIKLGEDMLGPDHALVGAWKSRLLTSMPSSVDSARGPVFLSLLQSLR